MRNQYVHCIYMIICSRVLSVLGVPYIRPDGTERKKFFYIQRQSDDSYSCPVCNDGHKQLSVPIEVDESSSRSRSGSGSSKDRTLSFQERVELHLADPSVLLPLANNEAERHYVIVRLQEHRDRENEKKVDEKARQAKKEENEKALQAKKEEDEKALQAIKIQREGFLANILAFATLGVTLGGFIFQGLSRLAGSFEPKVNYFLKIVASINNWLYNTLVVKVFGGEKKVDISESSNDDAQKKNT